MPLAERVDGWERELANLKDDTGPLDIPTDRTGIGRWWGSDKTTLEMKRGLVQHVIAKLVVLPHAQGAPRRFDSDRLLIDFV